MPPNYAGFPKPPIALKDLYYSLKEVSCRGGSSCSYLFAFRFTL